MTANTNGWCILRTSGRATIKLVDTLTTAGIEAWTPQRTFRRIVNKGRTGERKIEQQAPILPTVVFARYDQLDDLFAILRGVTPPQPGFSIFHVGDRVPGISDADLTGLREDEQEKAAEHQAILQAETREAAEALRIASIRLEANRRRAQHEAERRRRAEIAAAATTHKAGTEVTVSAGPAYAGLVGVIESNEGKHSWVLVGDRAWKIEAWRLSPLRVGVTSPNHGTAA